jgi:hypothetical protein
VIRLCTATAFAASLLLMIAPACGGSPRTNALADAIPASDITAKDFDPRNFSSPAEVDHKWFPLRPGTQLWFRGSTLEDGKRVMHRQVFTVTDLTKVIAGVRSVVMWDRDYSGGELVETELAFFAQDDSGNVWHLGEYPEEYENGKFVKAPAWLAGLKGAKAGIEMLAKPRSGTPSYSQGYAPPPINWVDNGKVYKTGVKTCVPAGCYRDVVVTREFETGKPDAFQEKSYAPGLGNVRTSWAGAKDVDKEVLMLVRVLHLDRAALAKARAKALALEHHAYKISKDVYGRTRPAVPR